MHNSFGILFNKRIVRNTYFEEVYFSLRADSHEEYRIFIEEIENMITPDSVFLRETLFLGLNWFTNIPKSPFSMERRSVIMGASGKYLNAEVVFVRPISQRCLISIHEPSEISIETPERKILHLENLIAQDCENALSRIYENAQTRLHRHGMTFRNVFRSWNFIDRILARYPEFNRVRDTIFSDEEVLVYPAGTWIGCFLQEDQSMVIRLHAQMSKNSDSPEWIPKKGARQCEAYEYGPKFSRAALMDEQTQKSPLYISGTAAVSPTWSTLYSDDIVENIVFTMDTVKELLTENSFSTENIVSCFVYFKNPAFLRDFERWYEENNQTFPYIYNIGDVCRDNWLFEIECIASA